jgi:hypothetical protein
MDRVDAAQTRAALLGAGDAGRSAAAAVATLEAALATEAATAEAVANEAERRFRGVTLDRGLVVHGRIGDSRTRSQGNYGVNSVVYEAADPDDVRCALKGLIVAHGPFTAGQGAQLDAAVRDCLGAPNLPNHLHAMSIVHVHLGVPSLAVPCYR